MIRRILLCAIWTGLAAPTVAQTSGTAFVGVTVIPMTADSLLHGRTVLVEGEKITAVGLVDSLTLPPGTTVVEASGMFLMPGLIDLHVHPTDESDFLLYLANGVTTIQYLNAFPEALDWGERVARRDLSGPSIHAYGGPVSEIDDAAQARAVVADFEAQGFRCLKIYDRISETAYDTLVAAARGAGLRTVGHIPRNLTWAHMLKAAPDAVAHAEEFLYSPIESSEDVDRIVTGMREGRIALITTLANYDLIGRQPIELDELLARPELRYYSPVDRRVWEREHNRYLRFGIEEVPNLRRLLAFQRRLVKRVHDDGGMVLAGTDAGNIMVLPGWSLHEELAQLVVAGLSPRAALQAATASAAQFLGSQDTIGTIAVGRRADLVLIAGNPLIDVANARLIVGVMSRGRWWPRDTLRARLDAQRRGFDVETAFLARVRQEGLDPAIAWLDSRAARGEPPLRWRALNELAYQRWYIEDRPEDGVHLFETNTRFHPEVAGSHGSLAEAYEAAGRLEEAAVAWGRALELDPGYEEARRRLERLEDR